MTLHYNSKIGRFYDDSNGRFVSQSRGLLSSVARSELHSKLEPKSDEPENRPIHDIDRPDRTPSNDLIPYDQLDSLDKAYLNIIPFGDDIDDNWYFDDTLDYEWDDIEDYFEDHNTYKGKKK